MLKKIINILILYLIGAHDFFCFAVPINFRSTTSAIQVANGARFVLGRSIQTGQGKIIRDAGGTFVGQDLVFDKGSFYDANSRFRLTGSFRPDDTEQKVILDGWKTLRGQAGTCINGIYISGSDNRLEGDLVFGKDVVLQDVNTSLTWAGLRRLTQNICMNEGGIYLEEDLNFVEDKRLVGNGRICCNRHKFILGAKEIYWDTPMLWGRVGGLELLNHCHLSETWTFSGDISVIVGNGNIISLEEGGNIVVENGATLLLKDVVLNNVSGEKIRCLGSAGKVIFQNAKLVQSGDFYFNKGSFDVSESLDISGPYVFVYQSVMPSNVLAHSSLCLESGVTFSYDPVVSPDLDAQQFQDLLTFQDVDSTLYLAPNSCLFANDNGMRLTKGSLYVAGATTFLANPRIWHLRQGDIKDPNVGIILGDAITSSNDFVCDFAPGAVINHNQGSLVYRNLNVTSMNMHNPMSTLCIGANATLMLNTSINMDFGRLRISKNASLERASGTTIKGAVEFFANE